MDDVDITEYSDKTLAEVMEADNMPLALSKIRETDIQKFQEDFDLARDVIVEILANSKDILEACKTFAKESDSPRAYEVFAALMNSYVSSAKDLVEIYERKNKVEEKTEKPAVQNNTQNNIYFDGSHKDLMKALGNTTDE